MLPSRAKPPGQVLFDSVAAEHPAFPDAPCPCRKFHVRKLVHASSGRETRAPLTAPSCPKILPEDVKRDAMSICWRKDLNCIDQYFRKRQEMQREVYKSPEARPEPLLDEGFRLPLLGLWFRPCRLPCCTAVHTPSTSLLTSCLAC